MDPFHGPTGELLRLREDRAEEREGTVEVVYADAWDDLCETASILVSALQPFAGADCHCYGELECNWCRAARALRIYHGE